ncbi:hypothetical protein HN954_02250 [bacterium]|nr:hypothetical protein [bacterium]MBT6832223.1 hypothetical protein [bacterium]MBT6996229.1 hypothetical protein [bacterium]
MFTQVAFAITYFDYNGHQYPYTDSPYQGQQWVTDPSTTGDEACYGGFDVTDCTAGGGLVYAELTCEVVANVAAVPASGEIVTTASEIDPGGYYYNCLGTDTYTGGLDKIDNWVCRADSDNVDNHIETECTGPATSEPNTANSNSDDTCLSGWMNCWIAEGGADDDNDTCLEQKNVTDTDGEYAHTHFGTSCTSYVCDSSWMSCDDLTTDPATDGTGCETEKNVTNSDLLLGAGKNIYTHYGTSCGNLVCDSGYIESIGETAEDEGCEVVANVTSCTVTTVGAMQGLTGVCVSSSSYQGSYSYTDGTYGALAGTCYCDPSPVEEFATGGTVDADGNYTLEPATMNTTRPLLWGNQLGSGGFVQLGVDGNADGDIADTGEVKFEINNLGKLTTGFIGNANVGIGNTDVTTGHVLSWDGTQVVWGESSSGFSGTLEVPQGGTGITSYTIGDLLYANGTDSLATIGIGTAGQVFVVGSGGVAEWVNASTVGDNLGNHTATQDINLDGNKLVGIGTTSLGLAVDESGNVTLDGTLKLLAANTYSVGFQIGTPTEDRLYTLPNTIGTNGQILSTNASGVLSWVTDSYQADTDTTIADGLSCTDGQVLAWDTSLWACTDDNLLADFSCDNDQILAWNDSGGNWYCQDQVTGSSESLDDAYDLGRTINVDAGPMELLHSGTENALLVWDGTDTFLMVNAAGQVGIGMSNPEYSLDVSGVTRADNFKLVSTTNGSGVKPTTTCSATIDGNIEYVVGNDNYGRYYGCKAIPVGDDLYDGSANGYTWVSMEVFGSLN